MEKWVTSRSLRKGSTTTMAIHPDLDHKFVLLRSGHSSRDNDRFYIASTVAGSLPGFKVLSGWAHPHAPVYSPHLESLLLPTEITDKLISSLFVLSIPEFKKDGRLYELTKVVTASLIMYFKEYNRCFGENNELCMALCAAVTGSHADLCCDPIQVLRGYSELILTDFKLHNGAQLGAENVASAGTHELMKQVLNICQKLLQTVSSLSMEVLMQGKNIEDIGGTVRSNVGTPSNSTNMPINAVHHASPLVLSTMQHHLTQNNAGTPGSAKKRSSPEVDYSMTNKRERASNAENVLQKTLLQGAMKQHHNSAKINLNELLYLLKEQNLLKHAEVKWEDTMQLQLNPYERQKYKDSMMLARLVATDFQRSYLFSANINTPKASLLSCCSAIAIMAFQITEKLEVMYCGRDKKVSNSAKKTYLAIGARIGQVKKTLKKRNIAFEDAVAECLKVE